MGTEAVKKTWLDLTLDANEELGILDSSFLEDFSGVDGQLTLYHQDTAQEFDILMAAVPGGGPYPNDHFEGTRDALTMPLGIYEIRGRCRDTIGNYTILTAFQTPIGTERVIELLFALIESFGVIYARITGMKSYITVDIKTKTYFQVASTARGF